MKSWANETVQVWIWMKGQIKEDGYFLHTNSEAHTDVLIHFSIEKSILQILPIDRD